MCFQCFSVSCLSSVKVSQSDVGTLNGKLPAKISSGRDICYFICNYSQSYFYLSHLSYYTLILGEDRVIDSLVVMNCVQPECYLGPIWPTKALLWVVFCVIRINAFLSHWAFTVIYIRPRPILRGCNSTKYWLYMSWQKCIWREYAVILKQKCRKIRVLCHEWSKEFSLVYFKIIMKHWVKQDHV